MFFGSSTSIAWDLPVKTTGYRDAVGTQTEASAGVVCSAGTAAKVIVIGQPWPASTCVCM